MLLHPGSPTQSNPSSFYLIQRFRDICLKALYCIFIICLSSSPITLIIFSSLSIFQCFKCSELCFQCCNFHQMQHGFLNTGNYSYSYFIYVLTIYCTLFVFFLTKLAKLCFFQYKISPCHPYSGPLVWIRFLFVFHSSFTITYFWKTDYLQEPAMSLSSHASQPWTKDRKKKSWFISLTLQSLCLCYQNEQK